MPFRVYRDAERFVLVMMSRYVVEFVHSVCFTFGRARFIGHKSSTISLFFLFCSSSVHAERGSCSRLELIDRMPPRKKATPAVAAHQPTAVADSARRRRTRAAAEPERSAEFSDAVAPPRNAAASVVRDLQPSGNSHGAIPNASPSPPLSSITFTINGCTCSLSGEFPRFAPDEVLAPFTLLRDVRSGCILLPNGIDGTVAVAHGGTYDTVRFEGASLVFRDDRTAVPGSGADTATALARATAVRALRDAQAFAQNAAAATVSDATIQRVISHVDGRGRLGVRSD